MSMNIHKEKEVVGFSDRMLLVKLLSFAKPYWKMIMLCLVLAFMIVAADLVRPYLLKIAVDENINGLNKPMIADSAERADKLKPLGKVTVQDGVAYVRVKPDMDSAALPATSTKKQIVAVDGKEYMIDGWIPSQKSKIAVIQDSQGKERLELAGQSFAAEELIGGEIKPFRSQDYRGFLILGIIFLVAVAGSAVLSYIQSNLLQFTGQSIIFNIREKLFTHLSRMSMSFFDRNPAGRLVVRVTQDTEALNQLYSQVVVNLIKDVIVLIGTVVIMLQLSPRLSLLAFTVLPILAIITFYYRISVREAQRKARLILSRLNSFLAENLSGMRITQLFIREERQRQQFDELNTSYYKAGMRSTTINSIFQPAIGFLGNLAIALLIWYGGINVIDGGITFGVVYAFTHYIKQFFQPLSSLAEKYNQIQTAMVGAERIFDMLGEEPGITDRERPLPMLRPVRGEIEFDHVWFAYQKEEWVLQDVSFRIEPGQSVAFVGATGAGKSSIIQLINRFYDIQKGAIRLDGVDIRDLPNDELRRCISVVQQDVFLFNGDIASNIRLNNTEITDSQVEEAAAMVHMDEFIRNQQGGYHTALGERGVSLSLGQRQLLSFARAIAFRPQILILDEATSNIDTETELIVQDALHNISKGRTTVIVAHRLSTIQHADKIIVMHKGKVREMGNHYQLLAQKGYYYRLFELQYKDQKDLRTAR